jgi:hypothetical protein
MFGKMSSKAFGIARHLQRDIEAFFHPELLHRVADFFRSHIERKIGRHFAREIKPVRIDVR